MIQRHKLTLGAKIIIVAAIPFTAYLAVVSMSLREKFEKLSTANTVEMNIQLVAQTSQLVHEIQRERSRSVAFLSGSGSSLDMESQRQASSTQMENFKKVLSEARVDEEKKAQCQSALNDLMALRSEIDGRTVAVSDAIHRFREIISRIVSTELEATRVADIEDLRPRIRSVYIVEVAKENAGQYRAAGVSILSADAPITEKQLDQVIRLKQGVEDNLNSPGLTLSPTGFEKVGGFNRSPEWSRVTNVLHSILRKSEVGKYGQDPRTFQSTITASIDQISEIVRGELGGIQKSVWSIQERTRSEVRWTFGAILGIILGLIALLWYSIRSITVPVRQGIGSLNQSSNQVSVASRELQGASQQISASATEAAASLEETVSSLEELSGMVKVNADHAREAASLSQASRVSAEQGEKDIQALVEAMTDISQSSKKIEEIINVIDDMAFQTNLLALNAAVEAARAGEQGKGFAVVAEAVRNLAQRSAAAARDITTLIRESVDKIGRGSEKADSGGKVFKQIVSSVKKVSELNQEIANASAEQANGISQISKAMNQLDSATQDNASVAEEAAASAEQLSGQAVVLRDLVEELSAMIGRTSESGSLPLVSEALPAPQEDASLGQIKVAA